MKTDDGSFSASQNTGGQASDKEDYSLSTTEGSRQGGQIQSYQRSIHPSQRLATHRTIAIIFVIVTAILAGFGVHYFLQEQETNFFVASYSSDAQSLASIYADGLQKLLLTSDRLATTLLAFAEESNATFPFVAQENFAAHAAKALRQAPTLYFQTVAFVPSDQRDEWENWVEDNDYWINKSLDFQRLDPKYEGRTPENVTLNIDPKIWSYALNFDAVPDSDIGYTPAWHKYPILDQDPM